MSVYVKKADIIARYIHVPVLMIVLILNSGCSAPSDQANSIPLYKVVNVIDGDTIDISIDGKTERIRLIGIDPPETVHPDKPVECFGPEASRRAHELLDNRKVKLESDPTQADRDNTRRKRLLRYVSLENGTDVGLALIREGYAREYTYNLPYMYQQVYKQAEREAKEAGRGLWSRDACAE